MTRCCARNFRYLSASPLGSPCPLGRYAVAFIGVMHLLASAVFADDRVTGAFEGNVSVIRHGPHYSERHGKFLLQLNTLPFDVRIGDRAVGCFSYRPGAEAVFDKWDREVEYIFPYDPANMIAVAVNDLEWKADDPFYVFVGDNARNNYSSGPGPLHDRLDVYYIGNTDPARKALPGGDAEEYRVGVTLGGERRRKVYGETSFLQSIKVPTGLSDFDLSALLGGDALIQFRNKRPAISWVIEIELDPDFIVIGDSQVSANARGASDTWVDRAMALCASPAVASRDRR